MEDFEARLRHVETRLDMNIQVWQCLVKWNDGAGPTWLYQKLLKSFQDEVPVRFPMNT